MESDSAASQRVDVVTKDVIDMQRLNSENTSKVFDSAMKVHENGASFTKSLSCLMLEQ